MVGVDIDQSSQSNRVITSVIKDSKRAVYEELKKIYNGDFEGGKYTKYGVKEGYIYLEMEKSRFKNFSKKQYNKLVKEISVGKIKVKNKTSEDNNQKDIMALDYVSVDFEY